jgi:iron complex transport system substrate-binding protein
MAARAPSLIVRGVVLGLAVVALTARGEQVASRQAVVPTRIVSIVPAVTEMLFAVGAGAQIAGVSSFVTYPPEVASLPRVGGLLDPDLERILSLRPDLVVVYGTQETLIAQFEQAGIPTFRYVHGGLGDILSTLRGIGARVGHVSEAERVVADIESHLDAIRRRVAGRRRPRTLVVFGRDRLALRNIYASGGVGFENDMLDLAGGINVFGDVAQQAVQATSELILARAPEVILEIRGEFETVPPDEIASERRVWRRLTSVPAVRDNRIEFLVGASLVVPGPRVAEGVERMARALHPEAFR